MTMRVLIWFSSNICRLYFEHPFRVQYLSLAALGLQPPGNSHQLCPGFLTHRVARGTLPASAYSIEDTGTPGRYSAEDECGA
jgi:hypothetical protein